MKNFNKYRKDRIKLFWQASISIISVVGIIISIVVLLLLSLGAFVPADEATRFSLICGIMATGITGLSLGTYKVYYAFMAYESKNTKIFERLYRDHRALLKNRDEMQVLSQLLDGVHSLKMSGMSLFGTLRDNADKFEEILERGGNCEFILIDPRGVAPNLVVNHFFGKGQKSRDDYCNEVNVSLNILRPLKAKYPNNIKIFTVDYIPPVSITILDEDSHHAQSFIEIYTSAGKNATSRYRPHLLFSKQTEPEWFEHFCLQFQTFMSFGIEMENGGSYEQQKCED